jgi:hypothetical protein
MNDIQFFLLLLDYKLLVDILLVVYLQFFQQILLLILDELIVEVHELEENYELILLLIILGYS